MRSFCKFCVKISYFSHGNRGWCVTNFTNTVKLAEPKKHTGRRKIRVCISYTSRVIANFLLIFSKCFHILVDMVMEVGLREISQTQLNLIEPKTLFGAKIGVRQ